MKKNFQIILFLFIFALFSSSCSNEGIIKGKYEISSINFASNVKSDIQIPIINSLPVFNFVSKNRVEVKPDFYYGYFKDSVYKYKFANGTLSLKGDESNYEIICEKHINGNDVSYELYFGDDKIKSIKIMKK